MLTTTEQTLIGVMIVPGEWQQSKMPWCRLHQEGLIQNNGGAMALTERGYQAIAAADRESVLSFIGRLLTQWHGSGPKTSPTPPATPASPEKQSSTKSTASGK